MHAPQYDEPRKSHPTCISLVALVLHRAVWHPARSLVISTLIWKISSIYLQHCCKRQTILRCLREECTELSDETPNYGYLVSAFFLVLRQRSSRLVDKYCFKKQRKERGIGEALLLHQLRWKGTFVFRRPCEWIRFIARQAVLSGDSTTRLSLQGYVAPPHCKASIRQAVAGIVSELPRD